MQKTIRIWDGCKVVQVVTVGNGSSTTSVEGGAASSINVDIEIDPWKGLIVDHSTMNPPIDFHEMQE